MRGKQPSKRKRGRPPMTEEERLQVEEPRIEGSYEGRYKFRPGMPHKLDVQLKEARNYRALITEQLEQLSQTLGGLESQDDPSEQISHEENALKAFLWETYKRHKHRDHIIATFLAVRRQRLLARLEAAHHALELAAELLEPDERILNDLRRAVLQAQTHARERDQRNQRPGQPEENQDEPEAQAFFVEEGEAADQEAGQEGGRAIDQRHIYGDANALREQLAAFDERVRQMRSAITTGIGWFEEYYVYHERITYMARQYIMRGEKVPPEVPLVEEVAYGPYLKYRWREGGRRIYTMQMGLIPAEEIAAAEMWSKILGQDEQENNEPPYPSL